MEYPKTPELDKMREIVTQSQAIGAFIDWLEYEKKIVLAEYSDHSGELDKIYTPIGKLLAEHFEIDLNKVEEEKCSLLDYQRSLNAQVP